jgi:hypothetical protein
MLSTIVVGRHAALSSHYLACWSWHRDGSLATTHQRLVVVINNSLMDNHQMELAQAMASRNCLHVVPSPQDMNLSSSCATLNIWNAFESFRPARFPLGNDQDFSKKVREFYGLYSDENDSVHIISLTRKGTGKKKAP